jgi:CheY-like chemotaxis protein
MTETAHRALNYLLLEDDDAHAFIIEQCIQHGPHPDQVERVKSGPECLKYLAGEEPFADRSRYPYPDVVLLDIRLPGALNGLETLEEIRADSRHRGLTVMMLTNSDDDVDVRKSYELGANGYIVKSGDTTEMIEKLLRLRSSFDTLVRLPEEKVAH